jgi:hypothetical protein
MGAARLGDTRIFDRHLRNGERILWEASQTQALAEAAYRRLRQRIAAGGLSCATVGLFVGYGFWQSIARLMPEMDTWTILRAVAQFGIAAAGIGAGAFWMWALFAMEAQRKAGKTRPRRYCATNLRLLEVDADGALTEELPANEIAEITLGREKSGGGVNIWGAGKPKDRKLFSIDGVEENPQDIKAILLTFYPGASKAESTTRL